VSAKSKKIKSEVPISEPIDTYQLKEYLRECDIILLNRPKFKYFGILLYGLKKYIYTIDDANRLDGVPIRVDNNGRPEMAAYTDGKKIVIISDSVVKNREVLMFMILHELLHIILGHVRRIGDRNPQIWNLAVDHVVNSMLKTILNPSELSAVDIDNNYVIFKDIEKSHPNADAETVYDILVKDSNQIDSIGLGSDAYSISFSSSSGKSYTIEFYESHKNDSECNSDKSDEENFENMSEYYILKDSDGKVLYKGSLDVTGKIPQKTKDTKVTTTGNSTEDDINKDLKQLPIEKIKELCETLEHKSKILWNSDISSEFRGSIPGAFVQMLDNIYKMEVPWEDLAESAILYNVQVAKRRTWSKKNIYIRNVRVPGKRDKSLDKRIFLGVIDTSGSISDTDLMKFSGLVSSTLAHFSGLHLLYHDYVVNNEIIYDRNPTETELYEKLKLINGRGGTSHKEVFDKISSVVDDSNISIIAFMTDFYSDVLTCYRNYDWVKNFPMIWFITNNPEVNNEYLRRNMEDCTVTAINVNNIKRN
jgi:predicted metal-dependent peptidase